MPLVFVSIWAASMELSPTSTITSSECSPSPRMGEGGCWSGWSQSPHLFYLIAAPMLVAYAVSSWQDKIHEHVEIFLRTFLLDQFDIFTQHRENSCFKAPGWQHSQRGPSQVRRIHSKHLHFLSSSSFFYLSLFSLSLNPSANAIIQRT